MDSIAPQRKRSPEDFDLLDKLGQGGMGQVYKARDKETDEVVAIKFLLPDADGKMLERLRVEAREHATLRHPHVVHLLDYLEYEGHEFLVMEFMDAGNLSDFLDDAPELGQVIQAFSQIADGLEYIHRQGLVHRDLKPENILFNGQGQAKIADLGMVRRMDQERALTSFGQLVGTTRYMAPEQILHSEVTPAADLYSLGVFLFEAVVGEPPLHGDSDFALLNAHIREVPPPLRSRVPTAPARLEELVASLLEKSPDNRPRTALQVKEQLDLCLEELRNPELAKEAAPDLISSPEAQGMSEVILGMSQPFRNSMNGVLGMAQLLQKARLHPEHRQYVEALVESAESLHVAFGDLIDFARIRAEKLKLDPVPTVLRGLIQNVVDGAQKLARAQESELFSHIDVSVPDMVKIDPLRLHQVLTNLVHQALRSGRRSQVSILVQREHHDPVSVALRFSVTDTVSSLTPQQARELFYPRTDGRNGYGLNLFVTHHLVEAMGGRCWADSVAGRGTTYTVTLKMEVCGAMPAQEEEPVGSLQILLADDQLVNQTLARTLLKMNGHEVKAVFNGVEVLKAMEEAKYDLVLMDMMMPEMDGLEATKIIREREKATGRHTPVVALTAMDQNSLPEDMLHCFDSYVAKPIDGKKLVSAIAKAMRSRQISTERASCPYDLEGLRGRVGGSQRHLEMMLQIFLETHEGQLQELDRAFRQTEVEPVLKAVGHLRSSLTGICAEPAAMAAQALEHLAKEGRLEAASHARRQLSHEIKYLVAALREQFPNL